MDALLKFWEKFNEFAYVSDMETHDLVYLNQKTAEFLGLAGPEEVLGKKCYEVLHKSTVPCAFCNNSDLEEGVFCKRYYYNPVFEKYVYAYNTKVLHNGRACRVELAIDVSNHDERHSIAQKHQDLEKLINEAVALALEEPTPSGSINCLLEHLGRMIRGERTYIFEMDADGSIYNSYEWTAQGIPSKKENLGHIPAEKWRPWISVFNHQKEVVLSDISSIREHNEALYSYMKQQGIRSLVVVPIYSLNNQQIGFFGVDNPAVELIDTTAGLLRIMGKFVDGALRRRDMVKKLHDMSYLDQQTRLGNRYALQHYMQHILDRGERDLGVIFCDITGLKRVNDTLGHAEGDALIVRASTAIRNTFPDFGLFRYGGDEFLVVCPDVKEADLAQQVSLLKQEAKVQSVNIAVGVSFGHIPTNSSKESVERLISMAETQMYQDKSEYYRTSGMDRRRH